MHKDDILSQDKSVLRRGDTVVRPAGPWTKHIHAFMQYLYAQGLPVPRVLPNTDASLDVVRFVSGEQIHPGKWSDAGLIAIAQLLRRLHDAGANFVPAKGATWQKWYLREIGTPSTIGHGDFAPWNIITKGEMPLALIDWEFAGPIDPMVELGRAMWLFVQLHDDDIAQMHGLPCAKKRAAQLRLMADAYQLMPLERQKMLDIILQVIACETAHEAIDADIKPDAIGPLWGLAWRARSLYWVMRHRDMLKDALS